MTPKANPLTILRKMSKLSQGDLSVELDTSQQTVSRWENGKGSPTHEQLARMAEILGITAAEMSEILEGKSFVQLNSDNSNHNGHTINSNVMGESTKLLHAQYEARIASLERENENLRAQNAELLGIVARLTKGV